MNPWIRDPQQAKKLNYWFYIFQQKAAPGKVAWIVTSIYQIYTEESIPTLHKLFQKVWEDGAILKSFPVSRVTQKTNPDKGISEKENYKPLPVQLCLAMVFHRLVTNQIWQHIQSGYVSGMQTDLTSKNQYTEHSINKGQILHHHLNRCCKICFWQIFMIKAK